MRYIIAGHNIQNKGAFAYNGKWEHEYNTDLQMRVVEQNTISLCGTSFEPKTESERKLNSEVVRMINETSKPGDIGIDIHFNNNNPRATGTEVIVHPNTLQSNKDRASWIAQEISKALNITHRRRMPDRDYIYPSETFVRRLPIIELTKIPMIIVEVCFLNRKDLDKYHGKEDIIARILKQALK